VHLRPPDIPLLARESLHGGIRKLVASLLDINGFRVQETTLTGEDNRYAAPTYL
jgi:hypothetical protein